MTNTEPPNFISFLACILSRLAYVSMPHFTEKYILSMNCIPTYLIKSIRDIDDNDLNIQDIFDDSILYKSAPTNVFKTQLNNKYIDIIKLKIPQHVNNIVRVKNHKLYEKTDDNVKIIEILSSNGHKINIVADKRFNSIFVIFRGTSTFKAMTSWLYINKLISVTPCKSSKNKFLLGFFKLNIETIHIIYYSICDLATDFLQATKKQSIKIFTTGHSLGGGLATIFSYLWTGIRAENMEGLADTLSSKIICIPIAAPKVLNEYITTHDFDRLLTNKNIIYKRIITIGDIVTKLPPVYFKHPSNHALYCTKTFYKKSLNKKTHKYTKKMNYHVPLICKNAPDTSDKSIKYSLRNHGDYMYIYFIGSLKLKDPRELKQSEYKDTVVRLFISSSNNNSKKTEYNVLFLYLNDIRNGLARDKYNPGRNIRLFDIKNKEDVYMNNDLFKAMIDSALPYEEITKKIKNNTRSNIKEKEDLYTSYGRPMFNMGQAIKEGNIKLKRRSVLCLTRKHMSKIMHNKTKRSR